jgi:hypothetical protein
LNGLPPAMVKGKTSTIYLYLSKRDFEQSKLFAGPPHRRSPEANAGTSHHRVASLTTMRGLPGVPLVEESTGAKPAESSAGARVDPLHNLGKLPVDEADLV